MERAYLHTTSWAGLFASPVEVLARGRKFARVRLLHQTSIGRTRYPGGTIKGRVPLDALGPKPQRGAYVSKGGGRYVPQSRKRA